MTVAQDGQSLVETALGFRERILAERDRIEAERRIPDDLARSLAEAGLFRLSLPAVYGGLDLTPAESMAVFEELARADASVAWCVWNGNAYWTAAQLSERAAREIFSDPNLIIANSTQPKGQAAAVTSGYRVSGRWSLVSGCQIADWMQLACIVMEGGSPRLTPAGTPQTQFMFCRRDDCQIVDTWIAGGLRGTGSHDVIVEDVFVPAEYASFFLDPLVLTADRYRFPAWTREIPGCGAIALGVARGAIETLVELAGVKRPERTNQTLAEDRGAQDRLAQAEALVQSARLFLYDAVNQVWDAVVAGGAVTLEGRARVRLATSFAVSSAVKAVDLVYLTGGATSLYATSPLDRAFRDVHGVTQHLSVHPRTMEMAGRVLFGLELDSPVF